MNNEPEPDEDDLLEGELPTDHNKKIITTKEQDQGVRDLSEFFANARPTWL